MSMKYQLPFAVALAGIALCIAVWLFRATPILLNALGPLLPLFALFLAVFGTLSLIVFVCLALSWAFAALDDRIHLYRTRRRYREMQLRSQWHDIVRRLPAYYRRQGIADAYLNALQNSLFDPLPRKKGSN
jgi:hypothetical protein